MAGAADVSFSSKRPLRHGVPAACRRSEWEIRPFFIIFSAREHLYRCTCRSTSPYHEDSIALAFYFELHQHALSALRYCQCRRQEGHPPLYGLLSV